MTFSNSSSQHRESHATSTLNTSQACEVRSRATHGLTVIFTHGTHTAHTHTHITRAAHAHTIPLPLLSHIRSFFFLVKFSNLFVRTSDVTPFFFLLPRFASHDFHAQYHIHPPTAPLTASLSVIATTTGGVLHRAVAYDDTGNRLIGAGGGSTGYTLSTVGGVVYDIESGQCDAFNVRAPDFAHCACARVSICVMLGGALTSFGPPQFSPFGLF